MGQYEVWINDRHVVGYLGLDNQIHYDSEKVNSVVKEMIAGQSGKTTGHFSTTARVVYRYDTSRKSRTETMYSLWKSNPIMQNRINILNALTFGRGLKWIYDDATQSIIDRYWRVNRMRSKLSQISTDGQLFGNIYMGHFVQSSGDVLTTFYEDSQVDIDFDPADANHVLRYIVTYKDEENNKEEQFDMMPIEQYLNNIEMSNTIGNGLVNKVKRMLGLKGSSGIKGKGVMTHIKFNASTSQVYGTSDFQQVSGLLQDYVGFVGDRLTIHQLYGSPAYDIEIDTDDENQILKRIEELADFTIGSNPVHNTKEKWVPLEFKNGALEPAADDKLLRGLICAGTSFPEYLLFNQNEVNGQDNTFSVTKLAEDRQDSFDEAFTDIHKFAVAIAGGDPSTVDEGQMIFPEINMMSEKSKAETYVLKVGANICSRETASTQMGHNWVIEQKKILEEYELFAPLMENGDFAGAMGGRFTSRQGSTDPNADHGDKDRATRNDATRVNTTQVIRSDKNRD